MNRTLLLLVAALAATTALVPAGAVPFVPAGADTIDDADLVVQPADGPNGRYALLNEDDEIELLLTAANPEVDSEGVNPNAVTPIPRVFTMTYTGPGSAEVWVTDDADDVHFFRGEDPSQSIEGGDDSVVLDHNATIRVGLLVDTRGSHDVEQADSFEIHARVPEPASDASSDDASTDDPATATPTRTRVPTATPTATAAAGTATTEATPTRTPTVTATGENRTAPAESTAARRTEVNPPPGGDPTEVGGFGLVRLAGVVVALLALLALLAARRYT